MASLRSTQRIAALRFAVPAAVAVAGLAFAWPADAASIQNWPVVLKTLGGRTTMIQRQPGNQVFTIWSTPASANAWNHYTIGLHLSDETKGGPALGQRSAAEVRRRHHPLGLPHLHRQQ
ncbi:MULTISPECIES: hypothetical protein [Streptomyces]|uniref:Uncharacterized protein n=1 Tax=Streptomyces mordarskii TaxID=1226758 RepID=A0ABN1EP03_9ACTN